MSTDMRQAGQVTRALKMDDKTCTQGQPASGSSGSDPAREAAEKERYRRVFNLTGPDLPEELIAKTERTLDEFLGVRDRRCASVGLRTPQLREIAALIKELGNQRSLCGIGLAVQKQFLTDDLKKKTGPQAFEQLKFQWAAIFRRLQIFKLILLSSGSLQSKRAWGIGPFSLRFRERVKGRTRQRSIHIGRHPILGDMTLEVLIRWRQDKGGGAPSTAGSQAGPPVAQLHRWNGECGDGHGASQGDKAEGAS